MNLKDDPLFQVLLKREKYLIKNKLIEKNQIKREFANKNRIVTFEMKQKLLFVYQYLVKIKQIYNLNENDKDYKNKIMEMHWMRDWNRLFLDENNLIVYVFKLKKNVPLKCYSGIFMKILQTIFVKLYIKGQMMIYVIRLLLGWHKQSFEEKKKINNKQIIVCENCNKTLTKSLVKHLLLGECINFNNFNDIKFIKQLFDKEYIQNIAIKIMNLIKIIKYFQTNNIRI